MILTGPKGASLSWLRAQRGSAWDSVYTSYTVDRMKSAALPYKWYVMALLFAAAGLNYADRTAITAVFPLLRRDLGMSDLALGATGTVFLWTYAAVSPFAGLPGRQSLSCAAAVL